MVLQDLDGHNLISSSFPALGHLPKRAPAEKLKNFVAVGDGAEDLVLDQLVVPFPVGAAAFGGGGRVGDGLGGGPRSSRTCGESRSRELLQNLNAATAASSSSGTLHFLVLPLHTVPVSTGRVRLRVVGVVGGSAAGPPREAPGAVCSTDHHLAPGRWGEDQARGAEREARCGVEAVLAHRTVCFIGSIPSTALHFDFFHPAEGTGRHRWRGENLQL